jgi:hypothetical protein
MIYGFRLLLFIKGIIRQKRAGIYQKLRGKMASQLILQHIELIFRTIDRCLIIKMKNFDFDKQLKKMDQNFVFRHMT